jgi:hypothetical protein
MIYFCANVAELNTLGKIIICRNTRPNDFRRPVPDGVLNEHFETIGTYEVYQVKCNLVNGLPPRYRGESD